MSEQLPKFEDLSAIEVNDLIATEIMGWVKHKPITGSDTIVWRGKMDEKYREQILDHNIHIAKPFPIPEHWPRYHAIDYGEPVTMVSVTRDPESGTFYVFNSSKKFTIWQKIKAWFKRRFL